MKLLLAVWLSLICFGVLAQTNGVGTNNASLTNAVTKTDLTPATAVEGPATLILAVIPAIVPLLIAIGKWLAPKIPKVLLPIAAPLLGMLLDWLSTLITGAEANPIMAAFLGSAGVGVREIVSQVTQISNGKKS